jgi:hypothetical protein
MGVDRAKNEHGGIYNGRLWRSGGTSETRLHYRATVGNALHPLSDASRCRLESVMGDVLRIDTQNINPSTVS